MNKLGATTIGTLLLAASMQVGAADKSAGTASEADEKNRAERATDSLSRQEENTQMPLPGQGYSHSSPLLDKAKNDKAVADRVEKLKREGKVVDGDGKQ